MDRVHDPDQEGPKVAASIESGVEDATEGLASERRAGDAPASAAFAWLVVLLGFWLIVGVLIVVWAGDRGLIADVGASPYHVVAWLALVAIALACFTIVVRAQRRGRAWRSAFPPGYGVFGAGLVVLLAFLVLDVGWREGVGIDEQSLEGSVSPSRILFLIGLLLVVIGPLRAGVLGLSSGWARLAALPSAALALALLSLPGGLDPIRNPLFELAPVAPETASEIWVMDGDGTHQTRVIEASDGYEANWPAWSPDGSTIAYVRWPSCTTRNAPNTADVDLWLASADGGNRRLLVGGEGWQWIPRWSPDGQWIAYTQEPVGGPWLSTGPQGPDTGPQGQGFTAGSTTVRPDADIWLIRAGGSSVTLRLTGGPGDDRSASWSPDSRHLVYDTTRDGNTELYVMDIDGANARRLTNDPAEDWAASWSPKGDEIAFVSTRDGTTAIYVVAASGGVPRRLTDLKYWANGPAWSPDGSRIAFETNRSGEQEIWSMAADGSDLRDLSRSPGSSDDIWDGRWAADGRIAYARSGYEPAETSGLARVDLAAATMLLHAMLIALVVLIVLRVVGLPFGAFALILGLSTVIVVAPAETWKFAPGGLIAGLAVDLAVRYAPSRYRTIVAGATSAGAFVLAMAATAALTGGLGWSMTILLGVTGLAGAFGAGLAMIVPLIGAPRPPTQAGPAAS